MDIAAMSQSDLKSYVTNNIPDDVIFRWFYIPFIVGDMMLDYLDTCYIIASAQRLSEVKKDIRTLKELDSIYKYRREAFFKRHHRKLETKHSETLHDDISASINVICKNMYEQVEKSLDKPSLDLKMFIGAGYMAEILHRAITSYTNDYINIIYEKYGLNTVCVMPTEFGKIWKPLSEMNRRFVHIDSDMLKISSIEITTIMHSVALFDKGVEIKRVIR